MHTDIPVITRFIFVRHGETPASRDDIFCGTTEAHLTPDGYAQAERLAARLRHRSIVALYSSPQQRALETAAPIAQALRLEIQQRAELREMDFGLWENCTRAEVAERFPEELTIWENGSWLAHPPDGETQQQVIVRGVSCISDLLQKHKRTWTESIPAEQTLLIVAHKTLLRLLIGHLLDMSLVASRNLRLDPASISEVRIVRGHAQLLTYNATGHLLSLRHHNDTDNDTDKE